MINHLQAALIEQSSFSKENNYKAHKVAAKAFDQAHQKAKAKNFWAKLFGKSSNSRILEGQPSAMKHSSGVKMIPLDKIVGSESRKKDFDAEFRPLNSHNRERWINIAVARRKGEVLPSIEVVQNGDDYYVRDGHHRVSVAKSMGQLDIEARIVN